MALFRKSCDSKQALGLLQAIVIPQATADAALTSGFSGVVSHDRLRQEFAALRLFAVLVASAQTRYPDWQARESELFGELFESTLRSIVAEHDKSEFLTRQWLTDRIKYYALSRDIVSSMDELGTEVGKGLGMLISKPPPEALSRLGRGVFFRAFEQTLARHQEFKLV